MDVCVIFALKFKILLKFQDYKYVKAYKGV